jgi:hypothetical protein
MRYINRFFYWVILGIRAILFPLAKIPFVLIIILLGFYALYINDQGQDLMATFTAKNILTSRYLFLFEVFLIFWAIAIWNVSRILLTAANLKKLVEKQIPDKRLKEEKIEGLVTKNNWIVASIDPNYRKALELMIKWTPRFLALSPYLIFIVAQYKQYGTYSISYYRNIYIIAIVAVLHFIYMTFRIQIWSKITNSPVSDNDRYSLEEQRGFINILKKGGVLINTVLTIIMTAIMFGYALWAANLTPSIDGKPGLILLTGFTVYTLAGLILNLIINRLKVPVFLLLIIFAFFVALKRNNNHTIQTLHSPKDTQLLKTRNKSTDSAYAEYWIRKKIADHTIDTTKEQNIFIVAAEGGGSRNCYWTYAVLNELQKINPTFYDHTFAATGVSGGSIGLGFYYNYKYYLANYLHANGEAPEFTSKIDSICSSDYLSRVTYGFMFPDLVQRFIPFRIDSWDRSKFLANSFDDGFSCRLSDSNMHFLSNNFLSMWSDPATAYRYPVLLFNSIFNEDGIKAVYSPYRLSDTYYTGVMDLLSEMNRNVPMKEAMLSSARFPVLMAPGLIWRDSLYKKDKGDSVRMGHLSDGGGFENTGIQTAQQTALLLKDAIKGVVKGAGQKKLHVRIISIGTGPGSITRENCIPGKALLHTSSIGNTYEVAWLNGGLNTIFGWINGSHNMIVRLNPDLDVLKFGLSIEMDSNTHRLPLGWYLSDTSRNIILEQATKSKEDKFIKNLKIFQSYNQVISVKD